MIKNWLIYRNTYWVTHFKFSRSLFFGHFQHLMNYVNTILTNWSWKTKWITNPEHTALIHFGLSVMPKHFPPVTAFKYISHGILSCCKTTSIAQTERVANKLIIQEEGGNVGVIHWDSQATDFSDHSWFCFKMTYQDVGTPDFLPIQYTMPMLSHRPHELYHHRSINSFQCSSTAHCSLSPWILTGKIN